MKPLIGITTQLDPNKHEWAAPLIAQNRQYPDAVLGAGGIPVLLPYARTSSELRVLYERLDGILFAGGGDIDPAEYGEIAGPILKDVSKERDTQELQLIKWALADNKPILGICRGMQLLNVALGGTLVQDIPSEMEGAQNHDISTEKGDRHYLAHTLEVERDSKLAAIIEEASIKTNTHHHQAIKKVAPGLTITGHAEDGIIESVELAGNRFAIAVQSHPESLTQSDPGWQKLFAAFVAAARVNPVETYSSDNLLKSLSTETSDVLEAL